MKLFLNADLDGKKCGYRDPETNKPIKFVVLYPYDGTEVELKKAKLMLKQNPHIIIDKPFVKPEPVESHVLNPGSSNKAQADLLRERNELKQKVEALTGENVELMVRLEQKLVEAGQDKDIETEKKDEEKSDKVKDVEPEKETGGEPDPEAYKKLNDAVQPTPLEHQKSILLAKKMNELHEKAKKRDDIIVTPGITKEELVDLLVTPPKKA